MKINMMLPCMLLAGCFSGVQSGEVTATDAQRAHDQHKAELVSQQQIKKELVAVLCNATQYTQAQNLWQQSNLSLVKKSSPTIVTLSWADQRTAEQIMQALGKNKTVFCATEINYMYTNDVK